MCLSRNRGKACLPLLVALSLGLILATAMGCESPAIRQENADLTERVRELDLEKARLVAEVTDLQAENSKLAAEVEWLREKNSEEIEAYENALRELAGFFYDRDKANAQYPELRIRAEPSMTQDQIARSLFERYLARFTEAYRSSPFEMVKDFRIDEFRPGPVSEEGFEGFVYYSVQVMVSEPLLQRSFLAGNGIRAEDNWIIDKGRYVYFFLTEDGFYEMEVGGTGP